MKITTIGGGPAGLYFSLLMKKANPDHDITVIERNPPGATFGWGVVFSEETMGSLRDADAETYLRMDEAFAKWNAIDILYGGERVRSRGHSFSAIARKELLGILQRRCAGLGVRLRFEREVASPQELPDSDLVVAADGVHSFLRDANVERFGTTREIKGTRFVWFGTDKAFDAFTFIFRENEHGLFQVHAYPFDASHSTFIVECPEETWLRAGLDTATEAESIGYCEKLFAPELDGHSLLSNKSTWINFVTVRNEAWHDGRLVLMGDAAHTAHFTIGSGTKLAMEDAVALAQAFQRHAEVEAALTDYEMERQPAVERFQEAAAESASYFENVRRYAGFEPIQFAFNLLTRSGRITYVNLTMRDPWFARGVDAWFAATAAGSTGEGATRQAGERLLAPPPMLAPLSLREVRVPNRATVALIEDEPADNGVPGATHADRMMEAVATGAGLVLTELVAVSPQGRITPGSAGMFHPDQVEAWGRIVAAARRRGDARIGLRLGHAGARGSTRSRREGLDRPLREGGWPLVAASARPFAPGGRVPAQLDRDEMVKVLDQFATAARLADSAGFDLLLLDMAHGYLLSSFLSPISNLRDDGYGGPLENRIRFPLEALEAVRREWPSAKPLAVSLSATEWLPNGFGPDDAVAFAERLKEAGCDLLQVLAGQTTPRARPEYRRFYLVPFSDRVRNEAGIATLTGGGLTTGDEVNTIVAAGRADLCVLDRRGFGGYL